MFLAGNVLRRPAQHTSFTTTSTRRIRVVASLPSKVLGALRKRQKCVLPWSYVIIAGDSDPRHLDGGRELTVLTQFRHIGRCLLDISGSNRCLKRFRGRFGGRAFGRLFHSRRAGRATAADQREAEAARSAAVGQAERRADVAMVSAAAEVELLADGFDCRPTAFEQWDDLQTFGLSPGPQTVRGSSDELTARRRPAAPGRIIRVKGGQQARSTSWLPYLRRPPPR